MKDIKEEKLYKKLDMESYWKLVELSREMNIRCKEQEDDRTIPIAERVLVIDLKNRISKILSGCYDPRGGR